MARVFIGVDPHKLSATIEVVDDRETVLATGRFGTDKAGYAAMRKHVAGYPDRTWAVEGSNGAGRPLAQRLLADGEHVVDVPAKLSAPGAVVRHRAQPQDRRPRRARRRGGRGAHPGAAGAGLRRAARGAAVAGRPPGRAEPGPDPEREPGAPAVVGTRSGTAQEEHHHRPGQDHPRRRRAADAAGKTRRRLAAEQIADLVAIEKKTKALTRELKEMVLASGSTLMELPGVGPVVAARTLADTGDVARFADRNRYASWTGTAPIEASSGEVVRHRLSRAGNRRMNHMIHIAAATQIRLDTDGRAYYRRKIAAGKSRREAMRCLKRRISDALYRQLRADAAIGRERGSGRAPRGDTSVQRGRLAPAHRHFGSATSRTRTNDATRAERRGRPRPRDPSNPPLDNRGVPKRRTLIVRSCR